MRVGDLILYGTKPHWELPGVLGILLRKLQYEADDDEAQNWNGKPAWWIQFMNDEGPMWTYQTDIFLVSRGN